MIQRFLSARAPAVAPDAHGPQVLEVPAAAGLGLDDVIDLGGSADADVGVAELALEAVSCEDHRVGLGDVRLHSLRHGFAVALLRSGVNVKVVSEALGHSRSAFTLDVYSHVLPGMGEQVAEAIEIALGGD